MTTKYGDVDLASIHGTYGYKDPSNANALIIGIPAGAAFNTTGNTTDFFKSTNVPAFGSFTLTVDHTKVVSSSAANISTVVTTTVTNDKVTVENVVATNTSTIRVYFSKPVTIGDAANFAQIATVITNASGTPGNIAISSPVAVSGTNNTVYDFGSCQVSCRILSK
ncbi:MAG: hypothetical protein WD469_04790 [Paenibacillaceae bacterium]